MRTRRRRNREYAPQDQGGGFDTQHGDEQHVDIHHAVAICCHCRLHGGRSGRRRENENTENSKTRSAANMRQCRGQAHRLVNLPGANDDPVFESGTGPASRGISGRAVHGKRAGLFVQTDRFGKQPVGKAVANEIRGRL